MENCSSNDSELKDEYSKKKYTNFFEFQKPFSTNHDLNTVVHIFR